MNLNKISCLLGSLHTLIDVLGQLPKDVRQLVVSTLSANGLNVKTLANNAVKCKHTVQAIPSDNFETLVAISTAHLDLQARQRLDTVAFKGVVSIWGVSLYPNDYGAFVCTGIESVPDESAPASIKAIFAWAKERGIQWVKLDCDASPVSDLLQYPEITACQECPVPA